MKKKKFFNKINMYDFVVENGLSNIPNPGTDVLNACREVRMRVFGTSEYMYYSSALSKVIWMFGLIPNNTWINLYRMLASWDGEIEALGIITTDKIYSKYARKHRRTLGRFPIRTCSGIHREDRRIHPSYARQEKKIRIQKLVSKNKQTNKEM